MKRSKSQAVYKFLPRTWISERDDNGVAVTAQITHWSYKEMKGIYEDFIENEIKRQIKLFGDRGGDISSFDIRDGVHSFVVVEPNCIDEVPDILGKISPLVFYCSSCGKVIEKKKASDVDRGTWWCTNPNCKKHSVKQLQMIYACECGYAQPVKIPYVKGVHDFIYRPNQSNERFKMFYKAGNSEKAIDIAQICPTCGKRLLPDNANSGRNYKAFTLCIINLVDHRSGEFYKKGIEAQKAIVAMWFGKMTQNEYEQILDNVELAFSDRFRSDAKRQEAEDQVRGLITLGLIKEADFEKAVAGIMAKSNSENISIERFAAACDDICKQFVNQNPVAYKEWLNHYSFKMMQYNTVKYARRVISLQDSINRQIEIEFIETPQEILDWHSKLGIKNMQVSCDIQIVNCTYGYSRIVADPKNNKNTNWPQLKMNAYDKNKEGTANLVYGAKLDTEGILFEIDQAKIIQWLLDNNIIRQEQVIDLDDELAVKKWFAEHVHGDLISMFGEIEGDEAITKNVFGLLHSMSHAFIKAAGEISGLSSNSLTEIIFVETASIFIYSQTSQGVPLGALSGMAEMRYEYFLRRVFEDTKNCIFDPVCIERDDTACHACLIIPEISCNHFNAGLGRKYMYSIEGVQSPKIGFWEM